MSRLVDWLKDALVWDALFGAQKVKSAGVNDTANRFSDAAITFTAPDTISCANTFAVPSWMIPGKYFRVNLTGYNAPPIPVAPDPIQPPNPATNHYVLFRVLSASVASGHLVITVDTATSSVATFGPVAGVVDGRINVVVNNPAITRVTQNGSTAYNVDNMASTGLDDGSGVDLAFADHYHPNYGSGPQGPPGPPGPPGSVWYNGSGPPSNSLGVNGDYYLNDGNGDVYQKVGGTWF